ncbi:MAG: hypothetical protein ACLFU1_06970 [Alphaproteobacteria bacterium]
MGSAHQQFQANTPELKAAARVQISSLVYSCYDIRYDTAPGRSGVSIAAGRFITLFSNPSVEKAYEKHSGDEYLNDSLALIIREYSIAGTRLIPKEDLPTLARYMAENPLVRRVIWNNIDDPSRNRGKCFEELPTAIMKNAHPKDRKEIAHILTLNNFGQHLLRYEARKNPPIGIFIFCKALSDAVEAEELKDLLQETNLLADILSRPELEQAFDDPDPEHSLMNKELMGTPEERRALKKIILPLCQDSNPKPETISDPRPEMDHYNPS